MLSLCFMKCSDHSQTWKRWYILWNTKRRNEFEYRTVTSRKPLWYILLWQRIKLKNEIFSRTIIVRHRQKQKEKKKSQNGLREFKIIWEDTNGNKQMSPHLLLRSMRFTGGEAVSMVNEPIPGVDVGRNRPWIYIVCIYGNFLSLFLGKRLSEIAVVQKTPAIKCYLSKIRLRNSDSCDRLISKVWALIDKSKTFSNFWANFPDFI